MASAGRSLSKSPTLGSYSPSRDERLAAFATRDRGGLGLESVALFVVPTEVETKLSYIVVRVAEVGLVEGGCVLLVEVVGG